MKLSLVVIALFPLLIHFRSDVVVAQKPIQDYDDYGPISWKDERFRLDNFAIQLQNDQTVVGYIFIAAAFGGCPGEAQARAIRAKRYIVEHGGVPANRVIWRFEGYKPDLSTVVVPIQRGVTPPYPFLFTSGPDGPLTKQCKTQLRQIARSRW